MNQSDLLRRILESGVQTLPFETWSQSGFPRLVASERLLVSKDSGDPMAQVLASTGEKPDEDRYCVHTNNFDYVDDDAEPIARFIEPVHDHLFYVNGNLGALSRSDDRTVLDAIGNELAVFPYKVHPQIVDMPDGSYVALALNRQDVAGTHRKSYAGFRQEVYPTIIYQGKGRFAALSRQQEVVISSGIEATVLGRFPELFGRPVHIGHSPWNDEGNGRIVQVGYRFVGLDWDDSRYLIHTLKEHEEQPRPHRTSEGEVLVLYGRFPEQMDPTTLTIEEHLFIALDCVTNSRVYSVVPKDNHIMLSKRIGHSTRLVTIPYHRLRELLSINNDLE